MKLFDTVSARAMLAMRRAWMKYAMKGVSRSDAHDRLDLAYLAPDPWQLNSPKEQHRFSETNRALTAAFGQCGTLLEIGCGEGTQSQALAQVCQRLVGLDVSNRATERARKKVLTAEFIVGDLLSMPWVQEANRFDVVVACEVLYYIQDVPATLAAMSRLGRGRLVTYFEPAERRVGHIVRCMPNVKISRIVYDDTAWVIATW